MAKKADNCQNNFHSNSKYMVRKNTAISILLTNETGQWNLSPRTFRKPVVLGKDFVDFVDDGSTGPVPADPMKLIPLACLKD